MLDIKKIESENIVTIVGTLSELEIVKDKTSDGREYVRGTAKIRSDIDIYGKMTENEYVVRMFSMKLKKDGNQSKVYDRICAYEEDFISLAAAETPDQATRVSITANIKENAFYDQTTDSIKTGWGLEGNFLNKARATEEDKAEFMLSGYIGKMREEFNKDGEETGREIVDLVLIGYNGKASVVSLIAADSKADHIKTNWEKDDTVQVTGKINMMSKTEYITIEQGFGEPIKRPKTISVKELVIGGGSAAGLPEDKSYDKDDIKVALGERKAAHEALKTATPKTQAKKNDNFDF